MIDIYALWAINAGAKLRVTANNAAPLDYETGSTLAIFPGYVETAATTTNTRLNVQVRLELKL